MAKKPTITTISSGYYSRQALNSNFEELRNAFDNTLSRDGSTPNTMSADFDLNSNDILNANSISTSSLLINGTAAGSLFTNAKVNSTVQFKVPSQYATIQAAVDAAVGVPIGNDVTIDIHLESGQEWPSQVSIANAFQGIRFTSEDATVTASDSFPVGHCALLLNDCSNILWQINLDMNDKGDNGVEAYNSTMRVTPRYGIVNTGANASSREAFGSNFALLLNSNLICFPNNDGSGLLGLISKGAARRGVTATWGSFFSLVAADLQNNGTDNRNAGHAAVFVSRSSWGQLDNATFSGSVKGIRSSRANLVSARSAVFDDIVGTCVSAAEGSFVACADSSFKRSGVIGTGGDEDLPILFMSSNEGRGGNSYIDAASSNFDGAEGPVARINAETGTIDIGDSSALLIKSYLGTADGGYIDTTRLVGSTLSGINPTHVLLCSSLNAAISAIGMEWDGNSSPTYIFRSINDGRMNLTNAVVSNAATELLDIDEASEVYFENTSLDGTVVAASIGFKVGPNCSIPSRTDASTLLNEGWFPGNNVVFKVSNLEYMGDNTAGDPISDMPGVVPNGDIVPGHFNVTGTGTETAGMQEWITYVNGRYGLIPRDMHIKIDAGLLIDTANTYVEVQGILEQVTWGLEAFLVENVNGVTINGQGTGKIISTQTKADISTSLANRWLGEVARTRSSAVVWNNSNDSTVTGLRLEGLVNGVVDLGGKRIYRTDYDSTGSTTTTMVLHPDDQEADDFYNGWVIRPLNVTDPTLARITDYDGTTNTVTVEVAWSAAPSETDAYYVLQEGPSVGNRFFDCTGDDIDFYFLGVWCKDSSLYDITCDHITNTQGSSAPPHLIYYTADGVYRRHSNVHLNSWTCYQCDQGSVVKIRGCDGLHLGDGYCDKSRGIADVEYSTNWTMGKLNGRRLGFGFNARPYGLIIAGGEAPRGGSILAHIDPDYDGGGTFSADLRPFGVWCQSLGSDNPLGDITNGVIDKIHLEWAGTVQSALGFISEDESSGSDGQISDIRVGFIYTDVPNANSTTARAVNGDGIIFDKVMSPNATVAVQFDANATNCRAKIDPEASGSITDNGTGNIIKKGDILSAWAAPTGTADRTTFATSTVTLEELAERVKALVDDLQS